MSPASGHRRAADPAPGHAPLASAEVAAVRLLLDEVKTGPLKPVPGAIQNLSFGPLPGWLVLALGVAFYASLVYPTFRASDTSGELTRGEVHV